MTLFDTPFITPFLRLLAKTALRLSGWKINREHADIPQAPCVLIGAPHTSNWDFLLMLCTALELKMRICWFGKHSLFRWPFGPVMRWMGGIAIDRRHNNNVVDQLVESFTDTPDLILVVAAEGTRSKVEHWKSGFYHIARLAQVPIAMVGIDGKHKKLSLLGQVHARHADPESARQAIADIRQTYYADIKGINPEKA